MSIRKSKISWKSTLVMTGVVAGVLGGVFASTATVEAAPIQSVYREYYNNASFGTAVGGRWVLQCNGPNNHQVWGRTSKHYIQSTSPCIGAQPPIEQCYADGFLIPCSSIPWW